MQYGFTHTLRIPLEFYALLAIRSQSQREAKPCALCARVAWNLWLIYKEKTKQFFFASLNLHFISSCSRGERFTKFHTLLLRPRLHFRCIINGKLRISLLDCNLTGDKKDWCLIFFQIQARRTTFIHLGRISEVSLRGRPFSNVQFAGIQVFVVAWNQVEYTANFYIAVAGWTNWPWKGLLVVVEGSVYIICQSIVVYKLQKRQDDTLVSRFVQPRLAYQLTHYSSSVWSSEFPLQVRTNAIMTSANDLFLFVMDAIWRFF